MSELFKGINSIWFRLFDHRGFLNGEIQYLLRELEQKRSDKEVQELFTILENITNIRDTQINHAKQLIDSLYPPARVDLGQALQTAKAIEDIEAKYKENTALVDSRQKRQLEWEQFIEGISDNCLQIDKKFELEEEKLKDFYKDLQQKLQLDK
ncbi:biogenesis of lysosome-related organelles complex 1 subunit 5 [Atheta coriaria]|uniref:biogenesis of lysosome-related organelles complex 1 subunit 5 n=1 Tax=Dalotia coriaria TaxID=877792 RepID=UPI0031F4073C